MRGRLRPLRDVAPEMRPGGCCGGAVEAKAGEVRSHHGRFADRPDLVPTLQANADKRLPWMHLASP